MISETSIEKFRELGKDKLECDHCFGKGYHYCYQAKKLNNGIPVFKKCANCQGKGFTEMTDEQVNEELINECESAIEERE